MNRPDLGSRLGGQATALLMAFLLFYFPSVLSLMSRNGEPLTWSVTGIVMATFYTVVFCVNYFWIVPWLLIRNDRKSLYFLLNFLLIAAVCALIPLWFKAAGGLPIPKGKTWDELSTSQILFAYLRFMIRDGIMMVLSAALAFALRLSEARELLRRRDLELSAEKRQIELKSLKAQLNPHFLFNSLNNIYALIGFAPERAQTALHDLSSMLRFMIYESGNSSVSLAKEMQFISDYTALMKLRMNNNISVECSLMDFPPAGINIPPLLFLTLVENAFKHVAPLQDGKGYIKIAISIYDDKLTGSVINTYNDSKTSAPKETGESGVGLENVRRQLRLLYPETHKFEISKNNSIFTASVSIDLKALRN